MSNITVHTKIYPVTSISEDCSSLLKPNDVGEPVEVYRSIVTDPRTNLKYNIETTYCIAKDDVSEAHKKSVIPLTDSKCALNYVDGKINGPAYAFCVPKKLNKDHVSNLFKSPNVEEHKDMATHESIKIHLNLRKIREATLRQRQEKLVHPLFKYFVGNVCLICGEFLDEPSKIEIKNHMLLHIKLGAYACSVCENKFFPTADSLFSHVSEHEKYECDKCNKKFSQKQFLRTHYQTEHFDLYKPASNLATNLINKQMQMCFICTVPNCRERLKTWKGALSHKNDHAGKEEYLCVYCNKSFSSSWLMKYHSHVQSVSKQQQYSCKSCHKEFSTTQQLRKHEKRHSRQIKYSCNVCGKKFNFKNSLINHTELLHS